MDRPVGTSLRSVLRRAAGLALATAAMLGTPEAQSFGSGPAGDATVIAAQDAYRRGDAPRVAAAAREVTALGHPLAPWVQYWEFAPRLSRATPAEVDAFLARWSGSYVEQRVRTDWLRQLGLRRDWTAFRQHYAKLRSQDDREVACYAIVIEHLDGKAVADRARQAWLAQRDADDGCAYMARTLHGAGVFGPRDVWQKVRLSTEQSRYSAARAALTLTGPVPAGASNWWSQPEKTLARAPATRQADAYDALALARLAAANPARAAQRLEGGWSSRLPGDWTAWTWAQVGRHAAIKLQPDAIAHYRKAEAAALRGGGRLQVGDDALAWQVRAALRSQPTDWRLVRAAIDGMTAEEQKDEAWTYWGARADAAVAASGSGGDAARAGSRATLESLARQLSFYGKLAAEDLGLELALPAEPAPLTAEERAAAAKNPQLARALHGLTLGLRIEGVREWNDALRGMDDRELLAAAQLACDRAVWDRCINTSERTRGVIDVRQRFPTPYRDEVFAAARASGLDPALVYGLIRQESRFVGNARSHAGASGLMQLMPATARMTAKQLGMPYSPASINDRAVNLRLGTAYLGSLLVEFQGSQALAAAGYNAGPGRPRQWRNGPVLDAAAWAEGIPFTETRDYVQRVLSNAVYYAALIDREPISLRARLGDSIGPRLVQAVPDVPPAAGVPVPPGT